MIMNGSYIAGISLPFVSIVPFFMGDSFVWLLPGLMVYFFGAGIVGAPWGRFILFSTEVSKGTASALMSMISMCIQAMGIELANRLYITSHNNQLFGIYCTLVAIAYFIILYACFSRDDPNVMSQATH